MFTLILETGSLRKRNVGEHYQVATERGVYEPAGGLEPNVYGCGGLTETMGLLCFVGCLVYFYLFVVSFGWECPLGLLPLAPGT